MSETGLKVRIIFKAETGCGLAIKEQVKGGRIQNTDYGLVIDLDAEVFKPAGRPTGELNGHSIYRMATHQESNSRGRVWYTMRFGGHEEDRIPLYCVFP